MGAIPAALSSASDESVHVHRDTYRIFCLLAGILSPAFGIIYHFTEPAATDPLWARFGLAIFTLFLLSLSYMSQWVKTHFIQLVQGLFYLLTAYFVGITALNSFSPNYALGTLFAMTVIGIAFSLGLKHIRPLILYLSTSALMCIVALLLTDNPRVSTAIMSVSASSMGLIIFVVARAKVQAEELAVNTEKRYHTLINAANDAIFIADPDSGALIEANQKAQELVDRPLDELHDMQLSDLYPDEEQDYYMTLFKQHIHEEKPLPENLHVEDRQGNPIPVDVSASLIDVGGHQLIQGIFRDATERQRYETQLIEAKEHAEELLKLKTSFLNNMSHELRTPLTSIMGYAEVLFEEADEAQRDFAEHIADSAKRLQATLNSVLDIAQLESGKASLELELLNVSEEVQDVVALLHPLAEQKKLTLDTVVSTREAHARVDAACINRITNNLVGNAIKFTEEGHVTVEAGATADSVFLKVEDTGVGIDDDFMEHLFDAFRQESTGLQRTHEGNGLGLAITKRLVDLMGGTIEVESEKGVGSTFTVFFPRAFPDNRPAPASSTDAASLPERAPFTGSVLVVEDNPLTRELIAHQLTDTCQIETAIGLHDALDLARRHTFDLVLLDIHLSAEKNGIDVLHALRALPDYEEVPAVALTAYALPTDRERFLQAGFDRHLSKPFTMDQLRGAIQKALDRRSPIADSPPSQ